MNTTSSLNKQHVSYFCIMMSSSLNFIIIDLLFLEIEYLNVIEIMRLLSFLLSLSIFVNKLSVNRNR